MRNSNRPLIFYVTISFVMFSRSQETMDQQGEDYNMEAFYAFLEAETASQSHIQNNNLSVSEETQKALKILRDLVSENFSLLLHPGRYIILKDTLSYLLSLPPNEGFSLRTKSVLLQLSTSFPQWILDYDSANLNLQSANADLSKAEKLKDDLEANVKEFRENEKTRERTLASLEETKRRLAFLEELKRKLPTLEETQRKVEQKINAVKANIVEFTVQRDSIAEIKKELFLKGRVMKAERDDLRNKVPRLKAKQECAKVTQANIEAEWSKLREQITGSTSS